MTDLLNIIYLFLYIFIVLYFVILGCIMLAQDDNIVSTHGEIEAKRRMIRSVGTVMFFISFDWFIYLPPMLIYDFVLSDLLLGSFFIFTLMFVTPLLYMVMHAVVQKKVDNLKWSLATGSPYIILLIWYVIMPSGQYSRLPVHLSAAITVAFVIYLVIRYVKEYRNYVRRIQSEYSETSGREIVWSWSCFIGFALQALIFIFYAYEWNPTLEFVYMFLTVVNGSYLCYCICRQKPLDDDAVDDVEEDTIPNGNIEQKTEEKAFYGIIEQKLESICEGRLLFLEPDLTREMLCRQLSVSGTYLKLYFHSRGLSFYHYINTLRVEYAYKLMQQNPDLSIRDVSEQAGFRSQTTFRKMFKEVMGCLPSEVRKEVPKTVNK